MAEERIGWQFIDDSGTFELRDPDQTNYLYFPLVNESLLMSAITPTLHGDIKIDHHHYLMPPVSIQDLHTSRASRNFFLRIGEDLWSVAGNAAGQDPAQDSVKMQAGLLWHQVTRENPTLGIRAEVTHFVPASGDQAELMRVDLTNISDESLAFTPIAAIPLYGRSADSLRDHRHVTSLLNRVTVEEYGVVLKPTLSFDERGHNLNEVQYGVFGCDAEGSGPLIIYPDLDSFIGEGGTLDRPNNNFSADQKLDLSHRLAGKEAFGGLRFADSTLQPGETQTFILVLAIGEKVSAPELIKKFGTSEKFEGALAENQRFWAQKLDRVKVSTGDDRFDGWMRWVSLQPILRRLMGNSFLPYHDYGRGGRGWRDLWQDALGLILFESEDISEQLFAYFGGIRLDGSNATIIGNAPGEFRADRNNIPRVWMDHGVWPLKTLDVYLNQTGDLRFLLRDQSYFKDHLTHRAQKSDPSWEESLQNFQRTQSGQVYQGSILEHLLVQHLTAFFHVGDHNNILLEGADWNDGMDMADEKGESVAFTAFYAGNLKLLSAYVGKLADSGIKELELASELELLLDRISAPVDYLSADQKRARLNEYFDLVAGRIEDKKISVGVENLQKDLEDKAEWLFTHLQEKEWIEGADGPGWYNGYYDNLGRRVEGLFAGQARMTLTGQVFPIMSGVATVDQIQEVIEACDRYLFDESMGGYRLNTDFGEIRTDLGRLFGFAYGTKENGAMFSHMAVMYAYGLYARGQASAGYRTLKTIYEHSQNFPVSRMYPGIPEYFGPDGRGYYFYLTGSASWYLFTMITQVYGIRGLDGNLVLDPKLMPEQFDPQGTARLWSQFADQEFIFEIHNPERLPAGDYRVRKVVLNDAEIPYTNLDSGVEISRVALDDLEAGLVHQLEIYLE